MPHDRSALIDQLRELLTEQRYDSVVIHNYCRSARHFLAYLARRETAVDTAKPDHVSSYLRFARRQVRQRHGHPPAPRWESIPRAGIHALLRPFEKTFAAVETPSLPPK